MQRRIMGVETGGCPHTAIREDAAAKNRKQGTVVCPRCGGELGYSISSYNGHIHGQCNTTRGCLSWMM